jgi:lipopolysaccharide heptosyltransferase I
VSGAAVPAAANREAGARTADGPRFLIIRLGSLGDVIHGIPAAAALRRHFPRARIDWIVDPQYVELLDAVDGLSGVIPFDPRGLTRSGEAWARISDLRRDRYDAVIDFQGLLKSATLARLAGGQRTIGFPRAHLREPMASLFYTTTPDPAPAVHVIHKTMALLAPIGVVDRSVRFPFKSDASVPSAVAERFGRDGFALINPGAAWPNKRWPPVRFGAVAAAIRREHGFRSLVLWGPGEESLAAAVANASEGTADVSPPTRITDILRIARGARLMVSGDTGPLHIAGAAGTPLVALFGPTDAARNGPWSPDDVVLSLYAACSCRYERRCRRIPSATACIEDISVDEVVRGIRQRLAAHG